MQTTPEMSCMLNIPKVEARSTRLRCNGQTKRAITLPEHSSLLGRHAVYFGRVVDVSEEPRPPYSRQYYALLAAAWWRRPQAPPTSLPFTNLHDVMSHWTLFSSVQLREPQLSRTHRFACVCTLTQNAGINIIGSMCKVWTEPSSQTSCRQVPVKLIPCFYLILSGRQIHSSCAKEKSVHRLRGAPDDPKGAHMNRRTWPRTLSAGFAARSLRYRRWRWQLSGHRQWARVVSRLHCNIL
jgi:hypothetical protein